MKSIRTINESAPIITTESSNMMSTTTSSLNNASENPTTIRKRAQSLVAAMLFQENNTQKNLQGLEQFSERNASLTTSVKLVNTCTTSNNSTPTSSHSNCNMAAYPKEFKRERRRASMQDAIDATKINADMYTKLNNLGNLNISSIQEENLGQMHLTLNYNRETSILTVRINQAVDLVPKDRSGTANPYCRVAVLPNRKNQTQTHIKRETLQPNFDEEFLFEVRANDWAWSILEVTIFDYDQFSKDECLGQVRVPLVDFENELRDHNLWKGITSLQKNEQGEHKCGDLQFSLAYLSSAKRLNVVILKARNLRDKNATDLYVKVTLSLQRGKKIKKKKTTTIRSVTSEWNEALIFNVAAEDIRGAALDLQVIADNVLGWVHVGPDSSEDEYQHWSDMMQGKSANARWHALLETS